MSGGAGPEIFGGGSSGGGTVSSTSTEGEAILAARMMLTAQAKKVQGEAEAEASFHGLEVCTISWTAEGAFRVNYPPAVNINVLSGLLARALAAVVEPGRYAPDGSLLKGVG